jgi:hypothetical protein
MMDSRLPGTMLRGGVFRQAEIHERVVDGVMMP